MSQSNSRPPHLFRCWPEISKRIHAAQDIRLFLDFDGTLVPICAAPKDVKLPATVRNVLDKLNRHPRVHVALVSGRRNATLRKHLRVRHVKLLGLYGWERDGGIVLPASTRIALPKLRAILKKLPDEFPGIQIEEKGVSFGIHFRGASPQATRRVQAWVWKLLVRFRADFRIIRGNQALEIVPHLVKGKGLALREYMKELQAPYLPIYLGDDPLDEPAFKVLRRGITVRVGLPAPTSAHFRLKNPSEVYAFLERLEKEVR